MMYLMVPLSVGAGDATQVAVARLVFCCRFQPVEGDGQDTIAVFVVVSKMVSAGALVICTYVPLVVVVWLKVMVTCSLAGLVQPLIGVNVTVWKPWLTLIVAPLFCTGPPSICHFAPAVTASAGRMVTCKLPGATGANAR